MSDAAERPDPDAVSLESLGADVDWTDHAAGAHTREAANPELGRLIDLAEWLSTVQAAAPPRLPAHSRLVVIGTSGPGPVTALAADAGVDVRPLDSDVDLAAAVAAADAAADEGCDLLALAVPGGPGTADAAAVAVAVLCDVEPVRVLDRGRAATDPSAWMRRAEHVRDERRRLTHHDQGADALVAALADPALAAATAFVLQAAVRHCGVLLDGATALAAALLAHRAQPRVVRWLLAADASTDPVHTLCVEALGVRHVLDFGARTGDGTSAVLALAALRASVGVVNCRYDDA